jgi:hypothetical protein
MQRITTAICIGLAPLMAEPARFDVLIHNARVVDATGILLRA